MKSLSPRPPLPLSATLTKEEAATIIQSFFRGYLARREGKAQLFRTWQRKVWEERRAVNKIKTFWKSKKSPTHQKLSETDRTQEGDEVGNVEECEKRRNIRKKKRLGQKGKGNIRNKKWICPGQKEQGIGRCWELRLMRVRTQ